jgi:hypothetical protein
MQHSYPSPFKNHFAQNTRFSSSTGLLLAALALPAAYISWLVFMPGGDTTFLWFEDLLLFSGSLGGAIASLVAAVRYRGTRTGLAWASVSLGMALMAFGEGAWGYEELVLGREVESPSVSDIGYLGFYLPVMFGLLAMPQVPVSGLRRTRLIVDTVIATGAISIISWHFLIAGLVEQSDGLYLESAITVAYPILDIVIISAAILVLARGGRSLTNISVALLTIGFVGIAASDSFYTYFTQIGSYGESSYLWDSGWVFGYALITVAAMLAAGRRLNLDTYEKEERRRVPLWQTACFNIPLIPVAAVLFLHSSGSEFHVDIVMLVGFVGLVVLVLARGLIQHAEHGKLYHELHKTSSLLQEKVTSERMQKISASPPRDWKS